MTKFCPQCGSPVEGMKFCAECGSTLDEAPAQTPAVTPLTHDEQVTILHSQIAELAKQGWHVHGWATPYEVSLRRKSGLMARQFMALWVEENGSV